MEVTIACECGERIKFRPQTNADVVCPKCKCKWVAVPTLFSGTGKTARIVAIGHIEFEENENG
jgi:hypothetical protein